MEFFLHENTSKPFFIKPHSDYIRKFKQIARDNSLNILLYEEASVNVEARSLESMEQ